MHAHGCRLWKEDAPCAESNKNICSQSSNIAGKEQRKKWITGITPSIYSSAKHSSKRRMNRSAMSWRCWKTKSIRFRRPRSHPRRSAVRAGNRYENKLVNLIVLIDDARFRRKIVERELKMIEMGFSVLDDYKRDLLEMHYVNSSPRRLWRRWKSTTKSVRRFSRIRKRRWRRLPEPYTASYSCNFGRRRRKTSGGASSDAPPFFCGPAGLGTGQGSDAFAGAAGGAGLAAAFFVRQNRPQRFLPQRKGRSRRPLRRGCNAERRALP